MRRAAGYQSRRRPKLRRPAVAEEGSEGFGAAPEDGLRMLAALETMSSLEPDFADDLGVDEASVTIIERGDATAEAPSLQARLDEIGAVLDAEAAEGEVPAYLGPMDEATVEIFEVTDPEPAPATGAQPHLSHHVRHPSTTSGDEE